MEVSQEPPADMHREHAPSLFKAAAEMLAGKRLSLPARRLPARRLAGGEQALQPHNLVELDHHEREVLMRECLKALRKDAETRLKCDQDAIVQVCVLVQYTPPVPSADQANPKTTPPEIAMR